MNYQKKHAVFALITAFAALTADISRAENFRFDENGHFPFIQISDFQVGSTDYQGSLDTLTNCLASCAERGAPELVILTGDQVQGVNDIASFRTIITPLIECLTNCQMKIAYAFGNHDSEGATDPAAYRQQQYDAVKQIAGEWFVDFDVPALTGTGSGVIPVLASNGGDTVGYNLFVMDSGAYSTGGYDGCHADQIQWYVDNSGGDTPCLWFQHSIVPEGAASIFASPARAIGSRPETPCPTADSAYNDNEHTLPPLVDSGNRRNLYDVWREIGNLRGAYFGHDHKNYSDGTDENGIRIGYIG